jgi:5-methylcytosine-specific restriction endonuclease McrA
MLQRVRELLSHQVPSGDLAQVLAFCLKAGLEKLQKRKFAATDRPRKPNGRITNKRTIPAHVKREVWRRDDGRCTFAAEAGKRCNTRSFLEFDHIKPVGRGGKSTLDNTRLRCRAHNQYEAECLYGAGFMHQKRERAQPGARGG